MINLKLHKKHKATKPEDWRGVPSTVFGVEEIYTSALLSVNDLRKELTQEEKLSEWKVWKRNQEIKERTLKYNNINNNNNNNRSTAVNNNNTNNTNKTKEKDKRPRRQFPIFRPLIRDIFIIDKTRNDTLNHL